LFANRFLPAYVKLREELEKKSIGDVYSVNVLFGEVITADRVFKKELGGGSILDIGIYCIQVKHLIFENVDIFF
jgi:dihydrodiol dehydrogenase / D-xylose 1-dehydrogenase (NADP)